MESNNNLKWFCFSGMTDDYSIWSTRPQMKGLFETLTGDRPTPTRQRAFAMIQLTSNEVLAKPQKQTTGGRSRTSRNARTPSGATLK